MEGFKPTIENRHNEIQDLKIEMEGISKKMYDEDRPKDETEEYFGEYITKRELMKTLEIEQAIVDMRLPLERIIRQIHSSIENGEYSTIIGDDASGRAPALVLGSLIKKTYQKNNIDSPQILFIGGAGNADAEKFAPQNINRKYKEHAIGDHLDKYVKNKSGKVLIVTDYIETGVSLSSLVRALDEIGIQHEMVTLSLGEKSNLNDLEKKLGKIYSGGQIGVPGVYRKYALSGVYKDARKVLAHPVIHEGLIDSPREVADTREKLNVLTEELKDYYDTIQ